MKTNETSKFYWTIDPPKGWKYGFPKSVTNEEYKSIKDFKQWSIDNGYPKEIAEQYKDHFNVGISGPIPCVNI